MVPQHHGSAAPQLPSPGFRSNRELSPFERLEPLEPLTGQAVGTVQAVKTVIITVDSSGEETPEDRVYEEIKKWDSPHGGL